MTLFELLPQDRLNYNGQIHSHYATEKIDGRTISRTYKRYHDGKRVVFEEDKEVELYGAHIPGQILFYKLKNIN